MTRWLALTMLAFAVGFGAYTASRLSDGALAVVAGVSIGLVASTVVGILLIYAMRERPSSVVERRNAPPEQQGHGYPGLPYGGHVMPPVIMMMPPPYPQQPAAPGVRLDAVTRVPYVVSDDDDA